jgi:hypothetical protein
VAGNGQQEAQIPGSMMMMMIMMMIMTTTKNWNLFPGGTRDFSLTSQSADLLWGQFSLLSNGQQQLIAWG